MENQITIETRNISILTQEDRKNVELMKKISEQNIAISKESRLEKKSR